ncbi:MAG TPA: hypothetical protein VFT98_15875 [Myxococcota bacterium]|nr:hypothetical protein [Myxococcota bacterium]
MTAVALREPDAPAGETEPRKRSPLAGALRDRVDANPLAAVVVAAGLGFALGGGVSRGMLTLLLGAAARAAGARLSEAILERGHEAPQEETQ